MFVSPKELLATNIEDEREADRYYCPFPGCKRSFAELWRLKVHYRAAPDITGSGKERGHGMELTECPKCSAHLMPGKHHVSCKVKGTSHPLAKKRKAEQVLQHPAITTRLDSTASGLLDGPGLLQESTQQVWTSPVCVLLPSHPQGSALKAPGNPKPGSATLVPAAVTANNSHDSDAAAGSCLPSSSRSAKQPQTHAVELQAVQPSIQGSLLQQQSFTQAVPLRAHYTALHTTRPPSSAPNTGRRSEQSIASELHYSDVHSRPICIPDTTESHWTAGIQQPQARGMLAATINSTNPQQILYAQGEVAHQQQHILLLQADNSTQPLQLVYAVQGHKREADPDLDVSLQPRNATAQKVISVHLPWDSTHHHQAALLHNALQQHASYVEGQIAAIPKESQVLLQLQMPDRQVPTGHMHKQGSITDTRNVVHDAGHFQPQTRTHQGHNRDALQVVHLPAHIPPSAGKRHADLLAPQGQDTSDSAVSNVAFEGLKRVETTARSPEASEHRQRGPTHVQPVRMSAFQLVKLQQRGAQ